MAFVALDENDEVLVPVKLGVIQLLNMKWMKSLKN